MATSPFFDKLMSVLPALDAKESFEEKDEKTGAITITVENVSAMTIPELAVALGEAKPEILELLRSGKAKPSDMDGVNAVMRKVQAGLEFTGEYEVFPAREAAGRGCYAEKFEVPTIIPTTYRKGAKKGQRVNPNDVAKTWYPCVRRIDPERQKTIEANRSWAGQMADVIKAEYGADANVYINLDAGTVTLSRKQ